MDQGVLSGSRFRWFDYGVGPCPVSVSRPDAAAWRKGHGVLSAIPAAGSGRRAGRLVSSRTVQANRVLPVLSRDERSRAQLIYRRRILLTRCTFSESSNPG